MRLTSIEEDSSFVLFRRACSAFALVMFALLFPATSYAQATLAGAVRDSSGAFLPGVTVETSSSALIEKVRTAVTDSTGQYQIVDLRPGTYDLTFSLSGSAPSDARESRFGELASLPSMPNSVSAASRKRSP